MSMFIKLSAVCLMLAVCVNSVNACDNAKETPQVVAQDIQSVVVLRRTPVRNVLRAVLPPYRTANVEYVSRTRLMPVRTLIQRVPVRRTIRQLPVIRRVYICRCR